MDPLDFCYEAPASNSISSIPLNGPYCWGVDDYVVTPDTKTVIDLTVGYDGDSHSYQITLSGDHSADIIAGVKTHASFSGSRRLHSASLPKRA